MMIALLMLDGCPNVRPAEQVLTRVLTEEGLPAEFERVLVADADEAERLDFHGSPSIHVDGRDIEERVHSVPASFGCRTYTGNAGLSGVPPADLIREAIRRAQS